MVYHCHWVLYGHGCLVPLTEIAHCQGCLRKAVMTGIVHQEDLGDQRKVVVCQCTEGVDGVFDGVHGGRVY